MKAMLNTLQNTLKSNAPTIFSATAITGVVTTAYLSGRASLRARDRIRTYQDLRLAPETRNERIINDVKLCWKLYLPTVASGAVTIGCIVGTTRVSNKRMAAAQAAFVISERAYSEYRAKVIEEYGERRDQTIRDSIASDRVSANPPSAFLVAGPGDVICCELHTGRYFVSDMESLRRAENDINARLNRHDSATVDDLYYLIGMPGTTTSGDVGWNSDKLLSLEFTSVLDDKGRPCLAFEYNPQPRPLFK